ncbi:MAG: hypothetical protein JRN15_00470 [Nitrososphaerota archaeon]|nr:hypothetical protein [Nitrososphaerota archaeon]
MVGTVGFIGPAGTAGLGAPTAEGIPTDPTGFDGAPIGVEVGLPTTGVEVGFGVPIGVDGFGVATGGAEGFGGSATVAGVVLGGAGDDGFSTTGSLVAAFFCGVSSFLSVSS